MIATFLKLFNLLTSKQRREFFILQCFMLVSSLAELVGTAAIMPFIALAAEPGLAQSNHYLNQLNLLLGQPSHQDFLMLVGTMFVLLIVISNLIMLISQFLMNRYSFRVGGEISARLYGYYLSQDILFHAETNSASLIQRIMRDSLTMSSALIAPALRLNARLFSIILLTGLVVYVDPFVALSTIAVLLVVYWFIFHFLRRTIHDNGLLISKLGQKRNQSLNESFGGIRDVKLYSFESKYLKRYLQDTKRSDRASADNMILGESPYFVVEAIVFAGMVLLTMYLYASADSLNAVLPMLTLFGMAGIKIVPKVQQCYLAITRIRSAQPVFRRVYPDLEASSRTNPFSDQCHTPMSPLSRIEVKDLVFAFSENSEPVFNGFSATFEVGEITAITGSSGSGKSTLMEILMGLVRPHSGSILIDGEPLQEKDMPNWRASIGYVPQEVYLADCTVAENIAFGEPVESIDLERVRQAAIYANIDDVISALPDSYYTTIGERGSILSGGQRQRIGIARALYRNVSLIFLDEATSALDTGTQFQILTRLQKLIPKITIIMITHRAETLAIANKVVLVERKGWESNAGPL